MRSLELSSARMDTSLEGKIATLEGKLKAKVEEVEKLKGKLKAPSPEAERLRSEVSEVKKMHRREIEKAESRVEEAEQR